MGDNGTRDTTCAWFGPLPVFVVNKAENIQVSVHKMFKLTKSKVCFPPNTTFPATNPFSW